MAGKEAGCFNNTKKRELGEKSTEQGWKSELVRAEQEAWQRVLGTRVEVKPLPEIVTPKVGSNLERLGLQLRYIPALDLNRDTSIRVSPQRYVRELARRYPKWKPLEELSYEEYDSKITRNLGEWYWEQVKSGGIAFPNLPGQWMAVEAVPKPAGHIIEEYEVTEIARKIGLADCRHKPWNEINQAISRHKRAILSEAGLPRGADLRLLEALEWNLLGNREDWGNTDSYEWTNTEYREFGISSRLIVGYSGYGGAGYVSTGNPAHSDGNIGFCAAIVLGS
jgi:hypothetical protein